MSVPTFEQFVTSTDYTRYVDIKKLKFIYSALCRYSIVRHKDMSSARILDVGCGDGSIALPVASFGCQVRAIDISEPSLVRLKARITSESYANVTAAIGDAVTYDDGLLYDVVIASEVFEHIPDTLELALNISRKLVPGGYLILTIPNGYGPWEIKNCLNPREYLRRANWLRRMIGKSLYRKGSGPDHCHNFTRSRLRDVLSRASLMEIAFGRSNSVLGVCGRHVSRNRVLSGFDMWCADALPYWMASGWYFVFEHVVADVS